MAKETKKPQQKPSLKSFQEEIRKRAEELYNKRKEYGGTGDTLSDWLQAEKEVKKKYGI
jgi:hypothetical protein